MSDMRFFGQYATFRTKNKSDGALVVGADFIVGTEFSIEFTVEEGHAVAWAKNAYDNSIGYFDNNISYRLDVMRARGWKISGLLSMVGYTENDKEETGYYWGELALFACPEKYTDEVDVFKKRVSEQLAEGRRPNIDITSSSIDLMLEAKGDWLPDRNLPMEKKEPGRVILKSSQSLSEKAIEKGRAGNKGCYAISWAFIIVVVAGIVFLIKTLLGW